MFVVWTLRCVILGFSFLWPHLQLHVGFPSGSVVMQQCGSHRRCRFDPWVGRIPWRRKWQNTPVFLPEIPWTEMPAGLYSPWGLKKSDVTEATLLQELRGSCSHQDSNSSDCVLVINKWKIQFHFLLSKLNQWEYL